MQFIDLQQQYQAYKEDISREMQEVLDTSGYILGPKVQALEEKLSSYVGTRFAVGCSSGTDALLMCLMAKGIKPGDEIITTPFTFMATAEVISLIGAKPVFIDICEDSYNIDPQKIKRAISGKTKGIIAVDLFGQPADYDEISGIAGKHGLFVIEDAAQSFGAAYKGNKACFFGEMACTSFFPAKPFGCYGDGGMIFLDDEEEYEVLLSLRVHGQGADKYDNVRIGITGRLDALQAAVLLAKWPHFEQEIASRQKIAQYYDEGLKGAYITPVIKEYNLSSYAQYCLLSEDRGHDLEKLKRENIPFGIYYPRPLHLMKAFTDLGYNKGDLPVCEKIAEKIFALPMHAFLAREDQNKIIKTLLGEK